MTKTELCKLLAVLDETYSEKPLSKETMTVWYACLGDIDYMLAAKAIQKIILIRKFHCRPNIAEIRDACLELCQGKRMEGSEAWGIFRNYINGYSTWEDYQALKNDYPEIYKIVHDVGGKELLMGNASFVRPEFERIFDKHIANKRELDMLPESFKRDAMALREKIYLQLQEAEIET